LQGWLYDSISLFFFNLTGANHLGDKSPSLTPMYMTESKIETSEQVKNALKKKQDAMLGKYGYSK